MAATLVGGALLGTAFGELLKTVLEVINKAGAFRSILNRLQSTLISLTPIVKEIEELNRKLDRSNDEIQLLVQHLNQGEILVRKCANISGFKLYKRPIYYKKLLKLDDSIIRFFNTNLRVQSSRDNMETLLGVNHLNTKFHEFLSSNRILCPLHYPTGRSLSSCELPHPPAVTVGLDIPLNELKIMLFNDDHAVVVLSAPGGCGKTTLAKKLCQDTQVKGRFKTNVFFVTVSKAPDLKVIIQKLIQHIGYDVPEFQTDEDAVQHLEQLLKQLVPDSILLILDDVWSGSESFLENFVFQIPKYKILITTRFVFPRFDYTYILKPLNDTEAMELFRCLAFPQNGSDHTPYDDLVNKIVTNCKGFPLALKVVARSLYGRPIEVWKIKVKEWSKGQSIFDFDSELLNCLSTSLDALNDTIVKECFMDLCSFPEDEKIDTAILIDVWRELYELDEDGVHANAYLHYLYASNLVNLSATRKNGSEIESGYSDHFVTQHDLLRELAMHQSSQGLVKERKRIVIDITGNNIPQWCFALQQQPSSARLLSVTTDETFTSSWFDIEVPEVKVLILNFRAKCYALPTFIQKMDKLMVIVVTNYGFRPAEVTGIEVLGSLSDLKTVRFERVLFPDLKQIQTIRFDNLQKASFVMCQFASSFQKLHPQLPFVFPNLLDINIDYCNALEELPASVCNFTNLKKLSVTNCNKLFKLPERIGNLANLEVLQLHSCTKLSNLPGSIGRLHKLNFLDISECVSLEELPEQIGQLCSLEKLHMTGCVFSELPETLVNLLQLKEVICDEEMVYQWQCLMKSHVINLKVAEPQENINLNWLHKRSN